MSENSEPENSRNPSDPTKAGSPPIISFEMPTGHLAAQYVSTRFIMGKKIGEGGMGVVYEAHDKNLNRTVALKVVKAELARQYGVLDRFFHEAEILGSMDHPGVPAVYETGVLPEKKGAFYAMKLVKGRTLEDMLFNRDAGAQGMRDELPHYLRIFLEVCQAVASAHSQKIVHRDLKPSNIMIDDYGVVLVMDWGLGKRIDSSVQFTEPGGVLGTPGHMSPEQASGDTTILDCRTDVFCLGIILYQILAGQRPFAAQRSDTAFQELLEHTPHPPRILNKFVNRELNAICMKAIEKKPEYRYATAKNLADDIQNALDGRPTTAYRRNLQDKLKIWARLHPAKMTAFALITTMLLILLTAVTVFTQAGALAQIGLASLAETYLSSMNDNISEAQSTLDTLEVRLAQMPKDDSKVYLALEQEVEILSAKRDITADWSWNVISALVGKFATNVSDPFTSIRPELRAQLRTFRIADMRYHMKLGRLFYVHFLLFQAIEHEEGIEWSDEDRKFLSQTKFEVETKLRERYGEALAIPDWFEFDPADKLMKMLKEGF